MKKNKLAPNPFLNQVNLKYILYGDLTGHPCVYFHGFPSSAAEADIVDDFAKRNNLKIYAFDRPGYGDSDSSFYIKNNITDFLNFIFTTINSVENNENNENSKIILIGVSGGAPYACSFADLYSSYISNLILIAPFAGFKSKFIRRKSSILLRFFFFVFDLLSKSFWKFIGFHFLNFFHGIEEMQKIFFLHLFHGFPKQIKEF